MSAVRAAAAVDRALDDRHREASNEVERILAAAVAVMARVTPRPPPVSDIVAEAGSSKKAFYRYFASRDELLLAVLERGVGIIVSYLGHQMAKVDRPEDKIACWISGTLAQVADPHLISMSRAVAGQLSATADTNPADDIMGPMRDLLIGPVRDLVGAQPDRDPYRDAVAVFEVTAATMGRYVGSAAEPSAEDIDHLIRFCLRALATEVNRTP